MIASLLAVPQNLTPAGWVLMLSCIGFVCGLCVFCATRLLREDRPSDHHHVPLDIDTKDTDQ